MAPYKKTNSSVSLKENYMDDQIYVSTNEKGKKKSLQNPRRLSPGIWYTYLTRISKNMMKWQGSKKQPSFRKEKSKNLPIEAVCPVVSFFFFSLRKPLGVSKEKLKVSDKSLECEKKTKYSNKREIRMEFGLPRRGCEGTKDHQSLEHVIETQKQFLWVD